MYNKRSEKIAFMGIAIAINLIVGFAVLALRLPIYLDTIGTILVSILLGPISGATVGGLSSIVNGVTYDPMSFYFIPVQVVVGIATGILFKNKDIKGLKMILSIIIITILGSSTASIIVAFVFEGVSSSGSSILVAILKNSGVSIITSVFSTQIFTDLLDKFISFGLVFIIIKKMRSVGRYKVLG